MLFQTLLILHITAGTIGLVSGTIATAVIKGKKAHLINGQIFFYSMLVTALCALVMSNLQQHHNIFLFAVGGFTFYMITTGYRIIWLKRALKKATFPIAVIDYALFAFGIGFGIFLVILSLISLMQGEMFGWVPLTFGLICMNYARMDYSLLKGIKPIKNVWMSNHITRMIGALIASYTAFLVVNVKIDMQWVLWLLPSAIGGYLIKTFLDKYAPKKLIKAEQRT